MFYKPKTDVQRDAQLDAMFVAISNLQSELSSLRIRVELLESIIKYSNHGR